MQKVNVRNISKSLKSDLVLDYCATYFCKLRGLAWRRRINKGAGIVLVSKRPSKANSAIHMLGLFFDLSIIWLDSNKRVVDLALAIKWRSMLAPKSAAKYVIECASSRLSEFNIGDQIAFEEC